MPLLDTTHPWSEVGRVGRGGGEDISFFVFRVSVAIRFHILIRSSQTRGKLWGMDPWRCVGAKDLYEYDYHLALETGGGR